MPAPQLRTAPRRLACAAGQGTVEYVALIMLVASLLAAVVAFTGKGSGDRVGKAIVEKVEGAIKGAGSSRPR